MSKDEMRLSQTEVNASGVVLGYWDHEKTQTLIQDLEQSISSAELKCKKLFEELTHYKKYLEKQGEIGFHLTVFKSRSKNSKNYIFPSGSEPEITFQKNFINFQKVKKIFEEKFQEKLKNINKELTKAAHKIGLKDKIILFPNKDHQKRFRGETEVKREFERKAYERDKEKEKEEEEREKEEEEREKEEEEREKEEEEREKEEEEREKEEEREDCELKEKLFELTTLRGKTKSDSLITNNSGNLDFSKITKNQLELYQNLSRWSMKKQSIERFKWKSCKRTKAKHIFKRKALKYLQYSKTFRRLSKKIKPLKQTLNKNKNKKIMLRARKSCLLCVPSLKAHSRDSENAKICQSLINAVGKNSHKSNDEPTGRKPESKDTSASGGCLKSAFPFTPCISSKCHKTVKRIQTKQEKKANVRISASEKMHEGSRKKNFRSLTPKSRFDSVNKRPSTSWTHSQTKSNCFEDKKRRGQAWMFSKIRRAQSKNREGSPTNFVKYHKSTSGQFLDYHKSVIQSESKRAFTIGSKIMVSDCQKTNIIAIGKNTNCYKNASGDGKGNDQYAELNMEWAKVYTSFLKIYRKYMALKKKVPDNNFAFANKDLISLEKDIDYSIEKYKEFLQYYSKFLHMNHRLKALKFACNPKTFEPVTSFASGPQRNMLGYKPTNTMAMKGAFRKVQALQDKINLVHD